MEVYLFSKSYICLVPEQITSQDKYGGKNILVFLPILYFCLKNRVFVNIMGNDLLSLVTLSKVLKNRVTFRRSEKLICFCNGHPREYRIS